MPGLIAPRRRLLPEIISILSVYVLVAFAAYFLARQTLGDAPYSADLFERLPVAVLGLLPLSLAIIFILRIRSLVVDLRAKRYGARLRANLAGLFLLAVAAASLPQGLVLLRLAGAAQSSATRAEIRGALASGQRLALAWYEEEVGRLERIAEDLDSLISKTGKASASALLESLRDLEPRIEAVQLFVKGKGTDYAGPPGSRLAASPAAIDPNSAGHLLSALASEGESRLRIAARLPGRQNDTVVITMSLPPDLEESAAKLGKAAREAELLEPFSPQWRSLLVIIYIYLVLPLLLLAALFGLAAADIVLEPLAILEEATRRVAGGDFGVRLIVKRGSETGRLVSSFNRMLGEIERYRFDELRKEKIDAWKDIAQKLAHELKNPLTPIRLAAERMLRRWKNDPEGTGTIVESSMIAIIKEVEDMDALLADFRAFASLPEPQRDWADLKHLIEEAVALFEASYPEIKFVLDGLIGSLTLRVDRSAMKRALSNLIVNSVDAMSGRGEIEIRSDLVKEADSRYCRLRIRDTGCGIPASVGDQIFVPYFTTKSSGTGLGLSIVERIVADHGGTIHFESQEGVGTTFMIDLPLDR
jgi:two-component system nitrogen regulation sensor histidine kinase NtrY